ncbi:MAG: metallophosphoesterase family protein [Promethearchaeota archaeon]
MEENLEYTSNGVLNEPETLPSRNGRELVVIHAADCHIGFSPAMPYAKRLQRMNEIFEQFNKMCNYAIRVKADIMLLAGDIYHVIRPSNKDRLRLIKTLNRVRDAGIKVFMVGGNHDMPRSKLEAVSPLATIDEAGCVKFFNQVQNVQSVMLEIKGWKVCIAGCSYNHFMTEDDDPLDEKDIPTNGDINIFMTHGNISMKSRKKEGEYVIRASNIPENVHYVALGHHHDKFQHVRTNPQTSSKTWFVYPGSLEYLEIKKNPESKGFYCVKFHEDLDHGVNVSLKFIELETRPVKVVTVELTRNDRDINQKILNEFPNNLSEEYIVKLRLIGELNLEFLETFHKAWLMDEFSKKFFHFIIDIGNLKKVAENVVILQENRLRPREILEKYLDSLIERNPAKKQFYEDVKKEAINYYDNYKDEITWSDESRDDQGDDDDDDQDNDDNNDRDDDKEDQENDEKE